MPRPTFFESQVDCTYSYYYYYYMKSTLQVVMPVSLAARVDEYAKLHKLSFSQAVVSLLLVAFGQAETSVAPRSAPAPSRMVVYDEEPTAPAKGRLAKARELLEKNDRGEIDHDLFASDPGTVMVSDILQRDVYTDPWDDEPVAERTVVPVDDEPPVEHHDQESFERAKKNKKEARERARKAGK